MTEPLNPYEAPRSDPNQGGPTTTVLPARAMPIEVKVTVGILLLLASLVGYQILTRDTRAWGRLALLTLLLWGIARGKALARQYLRVVGVLGFFLIPFIALALRFAARASRPGPFSPSDLAGTLLASLLMLVLVFLVSTNKARRFFGVLCPACGSDRVKARDFFFREKRCKQCEHAWR